MMLPLDPREIIDRLRLARSEGIGPVTFVELLRRHGSAGDALDALPDMARRAGHGGPLHIASREEAEGEIEAGESLGARLIVSGDPEFPPLLAALDAPPPVIWVRGDAARLHQPAVAVVGARVASAAGQSFARGLARGLGEAGYIVVSGLARGIDAAAHEGSLATGTVAVLAGGIDEIYPPQNAGLYDAIARQGCLVSERRPGDRLKAQDFLRRNRLISGLALGVVVVEAEMRSGSLSTARLAADQGREVFAVPGSPIDPRARGSNDLIRNGATLCEGAEDVIRVLGDMPATFKPSAPARWSAPEAPASSGDDDSDGLREALAALLSPTPAPRDEVIRASGAAPAAAMAALMELALAGRAELLPGGLVAAA